MITAKIDLVLEDYLLTISEKHPVEIWSLMMFCSGQMMTMQSKHLETLKKVAPTLFDYDGFPHQVVCDFAKNQVSKLLHVNA